MGTIPHDAQVMEAILKEMGVTDYEPRVISQMLEFAYRLCSFGYMNRSVKCSLGYIAIMMR